MSRRRLVVLTALATTALLGLLGLVGAAAFVWSGLYNVAATTQHLQLTYSVLERAMAQSVKLRTGDIKVPPLEDEQLVQRGALCFQANCVQCHGAPGVAPDPIGRSMQPLPGPLHVATQRWSSAELYWITRNGIKMSGMPAWAFRMEDEDLWAVVAFLNRMPELRPSEYRALVAPMAGMQCRRE
ncbi:c-type cytochrome [Caldimonas tepidiphila]|uniref:c-type cytochrome n=1 Tax=Caldimonas tepidiphila TaxID=2315841 RepID=UPI001F0B9353|nr:cytochrome c [Caldimonas tepidiphila]